MISISKSSLRKFHSGHQVTASIIVILLFLIPFSNSMATETSSEAHANAETGHTWHNNHAAIFIGAMAPVSNSKDTSFALGLSYERRLNELFGLEVLADFTIGSHDRTALFAAGVTYRPFTDLGLKLMTGPGFEIEDEDGHSTQVNFIYGVGAAWEFHFGDISVAPTVYADFLGETKTNITFGIGIGTGF